MNYTLKDIKDKNLVVFEAIMGSHAYGTSTPESDTDIRGVFIQPLDDILKYGFVAQVSDEKNDIIFYEIGRFTELLIGNNPNILEMLAVPDDCVLFCNPIFKKYFIDNKEFILSKKVRWTFAGYAIDQINKARGLNKKINWEQESMTRKTVLDFCYILKHDRGESLPFKEWLKDEIRWEKVPNPFNGLIAPRIKQEEIGLVAIDHAHDLYGMYALPITSNEKWGIVSDEEKANDVKLTSVPKGTWFLGYLSFNKDGYSSHCKKYKEYQDWLKNRNENRFRMNKAHGKNYDSKNMMHTYRLLLMAHELLNGELRVRRNPEEIEKLMKIRKGEYEYEDLLREAEAMKDGLDEACSKSNLPDKVDEEKLLGFLHDFRKEMYWYS